MTTLVVLASLTVARADVPEGTWPVDCVESRVSLTFSIHDLTNPDRPVLRERASIETGCGAAREQARDELFRMVLLDVCQVVGSRGDECLALLGGALGPVDALAEGPLHAVSVARFDDPEDAAPLAEVGLAFGGDATHLVPVAIDADGRFASREAVALPELATGELLVCDSSGDVSVSGRVSAGAPVASVEFGRTRTYLCSAGMDDIVIELELRASQRGGLLEEEPAPEVPAEAVIEAI